VHAIVVVVVMAGCPSSCSGRGTCGAYDRCECFKGVDGEYKYAGNDCSLLVCPKGEAWLGSVVSANNNHPLVECSNKGTCDTKSGVCACYSGFEGLACERTTCPLDCSYNGECYTQRQLAYEAGRIYTTPWDANKHVGCVCDMGYRGLDCSLLECASGTDPLKGFGNEAGRECSGRGICNYARGVCECFSGYTGVVCQQQISINA